MSCDFKQNSLPKISSRPMGIRAERKTMATRTTMRGTMKHHFNSPRNELNLIRFRNKNRVLSAIREGRADLAIARKNALAGNGAWEEVTQIESEIENLTEILSDIYL